MTILELIADSRVRLANAPHLTAQDKLAAEQQLDLTGEEHFALQQARAEAQAAGKISLDDSLVMYQALGETRSSDNGGWSEHADLATKYVVTRAITLARALEVRS